jgi:protein-tyrosine phosphatase
LKSDFWYASFFLILAFATATLSLRGGHYGWLLWPALSWLIVAISYGSGDVNWYGKTKAGNRNWFCRILLLPYLALLHIIWHLKNWISTEAPYHYILPNLIVARRLSASEIPANVGFIIDLTAEFLDPPNIRNHPGYICHPILDAGIEAESILLKLIHQTYTEPSKIVLIHCANGHGRTGMVAAIWLLANGKAATPEDAIKLLKSIRPGIGLSGNQFAIVRNAKRLLDLVANAS